MVEHQYCGLLAVCRRLECGAYGYFGLSEPNIAAYEPVHRPFAFHVGLYGLRGRQLVGGVLVYERGLQFVLHVGVGEKLNPFPRAGRHTAV